MTCLASSWVGSSTIAINWSFAAWLLRRTTSRMIGRAKANVFPEPVKIAFSLSRIHIFSKHCIENNKFEELKPIIRYETNFWKG